MLNLTALHILIHDMCWAVSFAPLLLLAEERSLVPNASETGSVPFQLVAEACLCSTEFRWDYKHDYNCQGFGSLPRCCWIFELSDVLKALAKRKQLPMFWRAVWPWRCKLVDPAWHHGRLETLTRKFIALYLRNCLSQMNLPHAPSTLFALWPGSANPALPPRFEVSESHTVRHTHTHTHTHKIRHTNAPARAVELL